MVYTIFSRVGSSFLAAIRLYPYLNLSLTVSQNYRITFEAQKRGQIITTTVTKIDKQIITKTITDIFIGYIMIHVQPSAPKGNRKFEISLVKIFSLRQKKSGISSYYLKIQTLSLQENGLWFL